MRENNSGKKQACRTDSDSVLELFSLHAKLLHLDSCHVVACVSTRYCTPTAEAAAAAAPDVIVILILIASINSACLARDTIDSDFISVTVGSQGDT